MANSHTITYPLYITAGGVNDDMADIMVTFEGNIVPYQPEIGPTYDCGGQPAEGGYAELTNATLAQIQPFKVFGANETNDVSWLIDALPKATLDNISELIYDDWMQHHAEAAE